jgi:hypothetical protein
MAALALTCFANGCSRCTDRSCTEIEAEPTLVQRDTHRRWQSLRDKHPQGCVGASEALQKFSHVAEADAFAQAEIERVPAHPWPMEEFAVLAQLGPDCAVAATRWAALRATVPGQEYAAQCEAQVLAKVGLQPAVAAEPPRHFVPVRTDRPALSTLPIGCHRLFCNSFLQDRFRSLLIKGAVVARRAARRPASICQSGHVIPSAEVLAP